MAKHRTEPGIEMIFRKSYFLFALICSGVICSIPLSAQRYEAESAVLAGGSVKSACLTCSSGQHVSQNDGNLTFNISVNLDSYFTISLRVAAPFGVKTNVFSIDNKSIDFSVTDVIYSTIKVASGIRLAAGQHVLKISKSFGYINIDYIEVQAVAANDRFMINRNLVTSTPSNHATRLYQFLLDNYGRKIISGVMTLNSFDETDWLKSNTGKEPALIGLDFMHSGRGYTWYDDKQPINDARTYYNRNGIVAICWHWRDPLRKTEEFYTAKTTFDVSKIFDESSSEYKAMLNDIDYVSGLLKILRDEQIPIVWRPLHEAAGGWFWWGAKGAAPCKKLYQLMFDRMVNYHGLNNLLWVWTQEHNDDDWYPGDQFVDIVGRDLYRDGDHSSQVLEWSDMNLRYGTNKMITLSETGSFPDVDNLSNDGSAWSWFMPWYGKYTRESQFNSLTLWSKMFSSPNVITLDEMPDLKSYLPQEPQADPVLHADPLSQFGNITVYPTKITDEFRIESNAPIGLTLIYNSLGQIVFSKQILTTTENISIAGFRSGLYYLKIRDRAAIKIMKI